MENVEKVVVTRHPALRALLIERGVIDASTPVLDHVEPAAIAGKHVIGVLPLHLAACAAMVSEVKMDLTLEDRQAMQRGDLSLDRTREVAGGLVTYRVTRTEA